jgi:hypothetical protein
MRLTKVVGTRSFIVEHLSSLRSVFLAQTKSKMNKLIEKFDRNEKYQKLHHTRIKIIRNPFLGLPKTSQCSRRNNIFYGLA